MDRLGIVSDVTGLVIDAGGNVGDSQAAKLGSHFGLMMEVTLPRDKLDSLKAQLEAMPDMNAAVYEDPISDASTTPQIGCKFVIVRWVLVLLLLLLLLLSPQSRLCRKREYLMQDRDKVCDSFLS